MKRSVLKALTVVSVSSLFLMGISPVYNVYAQDEEIISEETGVNSEESLSNEVEEGKPETNPVSELPTELFGIWQMVEDPNVAFEIGTGNQITYTSLEADETYILTDFVTNEVDETTTSYTINWDTDAFIETYDVEETAFNPQPFILTYNTETDTISTGSEFERVETWPAETTSEEATVDLSGYSSRAIEVANAWLTLTDGYTDIEYLSAVNIPAGTPLHNFSTTITDYEEGTEFVATYPEDVISLSTETIANGTFVYSNAGDGSIKVYNVPSHWHQTMTTEESLTMTQEIVDNPEHIELTATNENIATIIDTVLFEEMDSNESSSETVASEESDVSSDESTEEATDEASQVESDGGETPASESSEAESSESTQAAVTEDELPSTGETSSWILIAGGVVILLIGIGLIFAGGRRSRK